MRSNEIFFEEQLINEGITKRILDLAIAAAVAGTALISSSAAAASIDDYIKAYSKTYAVAHFCNSSIATKMKRDLYMQAGKNGASGVERERLLKLLMKDAKSTDNVSCDIEANKTLMQLADKFSRGLASGKLLTPDEEAKAPPTTPPVVAPKPDTPKPAPRSDDTIGT